MATKLKCSVCKFSWKPKTDSIPKFCPYCGRDETILVEGDEKLDDLEKFFK